MKWKARFAAAVTASLLLFSSCDDIGSPLPPSLPDETLSSSAEESQPSDGVSSQETPSQPEPIPEDAYATISFGGDILIHTPLFSTAKTGEGTYDFQQFLVNGMEGFFDSDWNVVNMENPVDVNGDNSDISTYPRFNAPSEICDFAVALGVDTAIFCNNHIYDRKYKGFLATVDNLSEKLEVAGAYRSEEEYNTPYIRDINGIRVGLLCYTDHVNSYSASTVTPFSTRIFDLSIDSAPDMISDIQALKNAGAEFVTVYLHWGSEYRDAPASVQKELAHALCEGGADMIVGGHSHCVQPIENYTYTDENGEERSSLIMYSLGNFFADQTSLQTMDGYGSAYSKTQHGMKVTVRLKKDGETGKVTVDSGEYVPTILLRKRVSGEYTYLFIESGLYACETQRPEIFDTEEDFKKCIDGYNRVCDIVGDVLPAKTYVSTHGGD